MRNLYNALLSAIISPSNIILDPIFDGLPIDGNADFIMDNSIIDIKVTPENRIRSDNYWQVIIYAILATRSKSVPRIESTIDSVGFYYARHGVLMKVPITITDALIDGLFTIVLEELQ